MLASRYPADARIVLTLTPRGPMVDGSPGEPVVEELDLQGRSRANPNSSVGYVVDVPLGPYVATAVLVTPDGAEVPLTLSTGFGDDATYRPALDVDFRPDGEYWVATFELTVTDL